MVKYRQHKIRAVTYFVRNLWILIIPVVRSLMNVRPDINNVIEWLRFSWTDLAAIALIILAGTVRWYFTYIMADDKKIIFVHGVIIRSQAVISAQSVSRLTFERGLFYRLAGAVSLTADMPGRHGKKAVKFIIKNKDLKDFRMKLENAQTVYKPSWKSVLRYSLFFSNAFSGFSYLVILIYHTGTITISEAVGYIGFSPFAAVMIFAACWVLSFVRNMMLHINFRLKRSDNTYIVTSGVIIKKEVIFKADDIVYLENVNGLISNTAGYASMFASVNGHMQLFMPLVHDNEKLNFYYKSKSIFAYIWKSFGAVIVLGLCTLSAFRIISVWSILLIIPAVWLMITDMKSYRQAGISEDTITYSRIYNFYTSFFNQASIKKVIVTMNPVQKLKKLSNVKLRLKNAPHSMTVRSGKNL